MTVTIFLIWTLVAGAIHDVDSFSSRESCEETLALWQSNVERVREQRPEYAALAIAGCQPVMVTIEAAAPPVPAPSMVPERTYPGRTSFGQ